MKGQQTPKSYLNMIFLQTSRVPEMSRWQLNILIPGINIKHAGICMYKQMFVCRLCIYANIDPTPANACI